MTTTSKNDVGPAAPVESEASGGTARHYLMCPPTYFDVTYRINDWMDPSVPVDRDLALQQWENLAQTYRDLGHHVHIVDPVPGLPDMVFVADSGVVVEGIALGARYRTEERAPEAEHVMRWFTEHRLRRAISPKYINEGGGDLLPVGQMIFAGTGFRTDQRAHAEAEWYLGKRVATVHLIDPRYYHLNTAMGVLDERTVAYLPEAFDPRSVALLRGVFPDAVIATRAETRSLGLNLVSDGHNVVLSADATTLAEKLRARGFNPVPVDMSEFLKAGGGIKCCTLELDGWSPEE